MAKQRLEMVILPDTNILIAYFLRKEPAASLVKEAIIRRKILFSVITVAEFLIKASLRETSTLNKILNEFGAVDINREIMNQAVAYRKQTERKTKKVYLLDCFLAATAKIHKAGIITEDTKDYPFNDIIIKTPEEITIDKS